MTRGLALALLLTATPALAGDDAQIAWAVEAPLRQTVIEEAVLGRVGELWSTPILGYCDSVQRGGCGDGRSGADPAPAPAPVPLPPAGLLLAGALAVIVGIAKRQTRSISNQNQKETVR